MDPVLIGEILAGTMFLGVIGFLLLGFPVAFTLAGTSILFAFAGLYFGVFDMSNLRSLAGRYTGYMLNEVLVAVPLFIFMGVMLERSNIAEQLLSTMGRLFGDMRGGLGISVILVGALLAASTGVVGATVVTMGLISLPAMLRAGYDPKLACGSICASGTLGQIIPPSTVLIFMGDMIAGMHSQVQMSLGNFAPTTVSVGDLFAGAFIPGLVMVALYIAYILFKAVFDPESCPATPIPPEEKAGLGREIVTALIPPLLLIFCGSGVHPWRHRHPDRSCVSRCRGRNAAGRPARTSEGANLCRCGAAHGGHHLYDLHHPVRRVGLCHRVPPDGRRRSGA